MTGISERLEAQQGIPVRIDSASPAALKGNSKTPDAARRKFWASAARPIDSKVSEVLEIRMGSVRRINLISFQIARFPTILRVEYHADGAWHEFRYAQSETKSTTPVREKPRAPVGLSIAESVPRRVNRAQAGPGQHPQHYGGKHWRTEEWGTVAVKTDRVRFVLKRNPHGASPRNPMGREVPYSLALRQIRLGYRVLSKDDVPDKTGGSWESSADLLGSLVNYFMYHQPAMNAIDGSTATSWFSEPQPLNYAVVPFFLDMRDDTGEGQVIDRFWVDPVTTGVHCHLYYSNDDLTGDFLGGDRECPYRLREEQGMARLTDDKTGIILAPPPPVADSETPETVVTAGIGLSPTFARLVASKGWWVGLDATALVGADDTETRPIVSLGGHQIIQTDGTLQFLPQSGDPVVLPLPEEHVVGARFRLVVSHHMGTPERGQYVRMHYQQTGYVPVDAEGTVSALGDVAAIRIGLHPDPDSTLSSSIIVNGLVIKTEDPTDEAEAWFAEEGAEYVTNGSGDATLDRGLNANAIVRMHPLWVTDTNLFGVVGGDGDRLTRDVVWHPVNRDYVLYRGWMEFSPTRAKYWKFEFTQLAPRLYESFTKIDRRVFLYPPSLVRDVAQTGPQATREAPPHGVTAMVSGTTSVDYADALNALRASASNDSADTTSALVITDPLLAQQAADHGWIWQYQPWHTAASSPSFTQPGVHVYEEISLKRSTKVGYFAGLKEVTGYRTSYTNPDDTEEYVERFLDDSHLLSVEGADHDGHGYLATGVPATLISETFESFLDVRGLQYAVVQTGATQVLPDPDFVYGFETNFAAYGDATAEWAERGRVDVERDWTGKRYADLEAMTYGDMEVLTYLELEGRSNGVAEGDADGGVVTLEPYTPMGAGEVTAKVVVSANEALTYPVRLEILGDDGTVLATTEESMLGGTTVEMATQYAPGQEFGRYRTYGDVEHFGAEDPTGTGPQTYEVGPASMGPTNPVLMGEHQVSTTPGVVWGLYNMPYYRYTPTESGTIYIDTFESGPDADVTSTPTGFTTYIVRRDETVGATPVHDSVDGRDRIAVDVVGGTPFDFFVVTSVEDPPGTHSYPPTTIRVRVSDIDDNTLWAVEPIGPGSVPDATYGDLETATYGDLEQWDFSSSNRVTVRVRQVGGSRDQFRVHRIALYDEPVRWSFSVDDGESWWAAHGVKNDPQGALLFPEPGRLLKWKAEIFKEDASISALNIRPWYGHRPADAHFEVERTGPNATGWDQFPTVAQHPMWQPIPPVEFEPEPPVVVDPFWRNLVPNPGAEGSDVEQFEVVGGAIDVYTPPPLPAPEETP